MTGRYVKSMLACAVFLSATSAVAKPKGRTQLELNVKPATALVFIDDKPIGKVGTGRVLDVTAGTHLVRLTNKGDEHEEQLRLLPNQKTTYSFEFDEAPPAATEGTPEPSPIPEDAPQKR